jgi:hypothetical protein
MAVVVRNGMIGGVAAVVIALPAYAEPMPSKEIEILPQDKVQRIKQECARQWGDDFDMRVYCEDKQYKALKLLIERGSEQSR